MSANLNNPRVVRFSIIKGVFGAPIGVRILNKEPGEHIHAVEVSTVCLENAHLEAPLPRMLDAEHGYETMVFFQDCSLFGIYKQHYETRAAAIRGHKSVVRKLLAGTLPLAIQLGYYSAWDETVLKPAPKESANA